jgi:hypothetical protein
MLQAACFSSHCMNRLFCRDRHGLILSPCYLLIQFCLAALIQDALAKQLSRDNYNPNELEAAIAMMQFAETVEQRADYKHVHDMVAAVLWVMDMVPRPAPLEHVTNMVKFQHGLSSLSLLPTLMLPVTSFRQTPFSMGSSSSSKRPASPTNWRRSWRPSRSRLVHS